MQGMRGYIYYLVWGRNERETGSIKWQQNQTPFF
jgi:hypothetical protein